MTVYYQFGSKSGLLEAVLDSLVQSGPLRLLPEVLTKADPTDALEAFIDVFCAYWE